MIHPISARIQLGVAVARSGRPFSCSSISSTGYGENSFRQMNINSVTTGRMAKKVSASQKDGNADNIREATLLAQRKERIKLADYASELGREYSIYEFLSDPSGVEAVLNTRALQSFQPLDSHTYRCTLHKIRFMNFEVIPIIDLHVTFTDNGCTVEMLSCKMDPDPIDPSVLRLQERHRSRRVWAGDESSWLRCRRRETHVRRIPLDDRLLPYVVEAGFGCISDLEFITLDWHLVTALVERWRPETHTFYMPSGEITITLQDVAFILGLRIDGPAVTGETTPGATWADTCEELLGVRPLPADIVGSRVSASWLSTNFSELAEDADELVVQRHARAYILQLLGGVLFTDKSGSLVSLIALPHLQDFEFSGTLSWGSAVLAYLYRHLCLAADMVTEEIGGSVILLQLWAWEHFPHIAPVVRDDREWYGRPLGVRWATAFAHRRQPTHVVRPYRDAFDMQSPDQFEGSEMLKQQNHRFSAFMRNNITWEEDTSEACLDFDVCLRVTLQVYTKPFTLLPISAIETPGNLVVQGLVDRLIPFLSKQLVEDYKTWVSDRSKTRA